MDQFNKQVYREKSLCEFNATLASESNGYFFFSKDAFMNLEWKVDFTVLPTVFCCGALDNCSVPKLGKVYKEYNDDLENIQKSFDFARQYFWRVGTMDDISFINDYPESEEFYKTNSKYMSISNITNNQILECKELIINKYQFHTIDDIKIGPAFMNNIQKRDKITNAIKELANHIPIQAISVAKPDTDYPVSLIEFCNSNDIIIEVVDTNEFHYREDFLQRNYQLGTFDYWYERITYMFRNNIYLNKQETIINTRKKQALITKPILEITSEVNPLEFLVRILRTKIDMYKADVDVIPDGRQKEYMQWVLENIKINDNFNFIPRNMLDADSFYAKALISHGLCRQTEQGLLCYDISPKIVSIVECN